MAGQQSSHLAPQDELRTPANTSRFLRSMTKYFLNAPRSSRGARGLLCFAFAATLTHAADVPPKLVQQFLGKYCLECHDADVQKAAELFER